MKKLAIVTGANRGIGKEIARQLANAGMQVILTARDIYKARAAAEEIGHTVVPFALDVTSAQSIKTLALFVQENYAVLDVLVNNAGIMGKGRATDADELQHVLATNYFGPIQVTQQLLPLLMKSTDGRIINMSSQMGTLDSLASYKGYAPYCLSKAHLNAFTIALANDLQGTNVKANAMCPGWVKTDMGGQSAPRTVQQGADTAFWLATEANIPAGKFFSDRKEVNW